jgi:hypothetical protein
VKFTRRQTASVTKILGQISVKSGRNPSEVFRSFALLAACALASGTREPEYLAEIKRWDSACHPLFGDALGALIIDMEDHPFEDRLGPIYMEVSALGDLQNTGAFYTPTSLCKLCARMTLGSELPDGLIEVSEPACGSGGMMLALAEAIMQRGVPIRRIRATCTDVDFTAVNMCFINLTLWGVPAVVVHGNALSGEIWNSWSTPLWLRFGPLNWSAEVPKAEPIMIGKAADGQLFMDWAGAA